MSDSNFNCSPKSSQKWWVVRTEIKTNTKKLRTKTKKRGKPTKDSCKEQRYTYTFNFEEGRKKPIKYDHFKTYFNNSFSSYLKQDPS